MRSSWEAMVSGSELPEEGYWLSRDGQWYPPPMSPGAPPQPGDPDFVPIDPDKASDPVRSQPESDLGRVRYWLSRDGEWYPPPMPPTAPAQPTEVVYGPADGLGPREPLPGDCSNGHANPRGQRFCGRCGAEVVKPRAEGECSRGHLNEPGQQYCGTCGEALVDVGASLPGVNAGLGVPGVQSSAASSSETPQGRWQAPDGRWHAAPLNKSTGNGALAAAILGLFFCGPILGVVAIAMASTARSQGDKRGHITAAFAIGLIDIIGWIMLLVAWSTT